MLSYYEGNVNCPKMTRENQLNASIKSRVRKYMISKSFQVASNCNSKIKSIYTV